MVNYKDIQNLQIAAAALESKASKGRASREDLDDMRGAMLDVAGEFAEEFGDEELATIEDKYINFKPDVEHALLWMKEVVADIANLALKAFKLMFENAKDAAKKHTEWSSSNVAYKPEPTVDVYKTRESSKNKPKTYESGTIDRSANRDRGWAEYQASRSGKSNMVVVKSSEAKERERTEQRKREQARMQASFNFGSGAGFEETEPEAAMSFNH